MPEISVIIPVYNRTATLKDGVESVMIQSCKPSEIIVIDDGSFFNISSLLKNYKNSVKIYRFDKNKGVSAARNYGISLSKGEYIAFLDSDDIFLPEKLEHQIKFMEENNYSISHTNEFWYKKDKYINQGKTNKRYGGFILDKILDKCRISPSSLIIKKEVFEKTGVFNEELQVCEDYDLSLRLALFYEIGYLDKKLIIKRAVEENSLSASIKHIEYIRYNILNNFYNQYKSQLNDTYKVAIKNEIIHKKHIISPFLNHR